MIELISTEIENAVAIRVSGKITESDMNLVLSDARDKVERYGRIVILEVIESIQGIEVASLLEKLKYLFEVGISNIIKIAIVTDKKWLVKIVGIEDIIFKGIDMKSFSTDDYQSAINFLQDAS